MTALTHTNIETDLEKAKDGRWVLLIAPDVGQHDGDGPTWDDDHVPPVVLAKWVETPEEFGNWTHLWAAGQCEGFCIEGAAGFVELSDLGLYSERLRTSIAQLDAGQGTERELFDLEEDEAYIDVSSDGVAELVHPDGSREPAPEGWDEGGLKATRLK